MHHECEHKIFNGKHCLRCDTEQKLRLSSLMLHILLHLYNFT